MSLENNKENRYVKNSVDYSSYECEKETGQNPNDLNDWTPLIYSHIMKQYAPVGLNNPKDDSMGNIDFDLKIDGDKLDILLFGSSLTGTTKELVLTEKDKALHSGIYSCNLSNLQGGQYQALTEDDRKGVILILW